MSPTANKVANDEDHQQPWADDGRERIGAHGEIEEVKEERRKTQEKLMDHIMNLEKRMKRIGASQEKKERYKCHEASVIGSVLGQGKPMSREA